MFSILRRATVLSVMLLGLIGVVGATPVTAQFEEFGQEASNQQQDAANTGQNGAGTAAGDPKAGVCEGIAIATGQQCGSTASKTGVGKTVKLVVNILSWIVGIAAVIMIIIGGFKYVTSSGDSNGISSAKNTILFAIVGLVVVAMAQVIVTFVIDKLPG